MKLVLLASAILVGMSVPAFATNSTMTNQTTFGIQQVTGANQNNVVSIQGSGVGSGGKVTVGSNNHTVVNQNKTTNDNRKYSTVNHQKTVNHTNQGGSASASATGGQGGAGGQGGEVTNTVNGGNVVVEAGRRSAIAPAMGGMASGPCTGQSAGLSLGGMTFSGGFQGSTEDKQCTLRENIRIVSQFDPSVAAEMLNDLDGVQAARQRLATARPVQTGTATQTAMAPIGRVTVEPTGPTNWLGATDTIASHTR